MEDAVKQQKIECDECGKEFFGPSCQGQLTQHKKTHVTQARKRVEDLRRQERIPLGMPQRKFSCPENDEYHYRIFNDNWSKEPDRIQRAMAAGYEIVEGKEPIAVGTNEDGSGIKGILMKIPKEFYEEDQALKQKEVDKVDEAIMKGSFEQKPGEVRYSPAGIRITSGHSEPK